MTYSKYNVTDILMDRSFISQQASENLITLELFIPYYRLDTLSLMAEHTANGQLSVRNTVNHRQSNYIPHVTSPLNCAVGLIIIHSYSIWQNKNFEMNENPYFLI